MDGVFGGKDPGMLKGADGLFSKPSPGLYQDLGRGLLGQVSAMHCRIPQPERVGSIMRPETQPGIQRAQKTLSLVKECAGVVFDAVPVMMYKLDEEGVYLKVNPRWLSAMGFEAQEVLGQRFTNFLTEECLIQSLSDTLPLFWESGRVHCSACRLLRKDARVLYVAWDAVVTQEPLGKLGAVGVFRKADDLVQWQWSKNSIKALQSLASAQQTIENRLLTNEWNPLTRQAGTQVPVYPGAPTDPPQDVHGIPPELSSTLQEIAATLEVLADLATDDTTGSQSNPHELVTLAETFQTALAELRTDSE